MVGLAINVPVSVHVLRIMVVSNAVNCIKIPIRVVKRYRSKMALYSYWWHSLAAFVDLGYAVLFCDALVQFLKFLKLSLNILSSFSSKCLKRVWLTRRVFSTAKDSKLRMTPFGFSDVNMIQRRVKILHPLVFVLFCFVLFYRFIKTECLIMYRHGRAYCRCQIQTLVDLPPELSPHRLFWNDNRQRLGLHVEMWANGYCASLDQLSSGYVTVVYCLSSNTIILFL